ncbi:MAG TPA: MarR family transcriptional regulator [Acidimicrobiales bacterium]|nr:MarR family transcriptional regulator [Acidimicrobiales bacterium]
MNETTSRVGYLIKRTQMVLHNAMSEALAPQSLTVTEFAVLTALQEEPGLSNADLARRTFVTPQSMHAVFKELESRGLLVRHARPEHRRVLRAELTESGRATLEKAADAVNAVEERMLGSLPDRARLRLARALSSCVDALI